ncbi:MULTISPECIES: hypothetical protein [unclassified Saccharopolyspora]|uniref:hypothetical protein n=1 Tax=unclassified Saccharopolyspora TaxID=2646250 RepID=UPI001CD6EA59|nr:MULTISPECIES: hypothetical protein [unclassified Saccharopolyspora]MCA1187996.1 hypothetical protein [Saccharopolyspora sp. 6T]MCA1194425.1 hypothetical protein [Saccharopolyspora sp. 6V]MCA1229700.1 hypothetical protein [Saccharopolyspora sp. 6M]MCA1283096.1 hypothetical protein [Saccharopolyspora sp. 7B]
MDTTADAPQTARSRRSARPDPAEVWAPLAGLADAAAQGGTSGAVAITRGFDRNSRLRAKALRDLLEERGVAAIEITPAVGSERLLADSEITSVVNLIGAGSWQPYRLAAKLRAPLLAVRGDEEAGQDSRDVIGVTAAEDRRDVALSHVAVRPETEGQGSLIVTADGEPISVPGGSAVVTLREQRLEVRLAGPDFAEQTFAATEVRVETADAPHRLVRDELPIADFEGALTFTAEPGALTVRPV